MLSSMQKEVNRRQMGWFVLSERMGIKHQTKGGKNAERGK